MKETWRSAFHLKDGVSTGLGVKYCVSTGFEANHVYPRLLDGCGWDDTLPGLALVVRDGGGRVVARVSCTLLVAPPTHLEVLGEPRMIACKSVARGP